MENGWEKVKIITDGICFVIKVVLIIVLIPIIVLFAFAKGLTENIK